MTTIAVMSASTATSYFEKDSYFNAKEGEWFGKTANEFELEGGVNKKDFIALVNGFDPMQFSVEDAKKIEAINKNENILNDLAEKINKLEDGVQKQEALSALNEAIVAHNQERKDFNAQKGDAKLVQDQKGDNGILTHRAGFDVTFSAPKSISVASNVLGDQNMQLAHDAAVNAAIKYIEDNLSQARVWNGEFQEKVNTGNLAIAKFEHNTSRGQDGQTPDPQLHTHAFVLNMTKTENGYRALEPREIFKAQKDLGQIYQNELAKQLSEKGYELEWSRQKNGNYTVELKHMPKEVLHLYDKRSDAITLEKNELESKLGRELTANEKNIVTKSTRDFKTHQDLDELKQDWQAQLNSQGYSVDNIKATLQTKEQTNQNIQGKLYESANKIQQSHINEHIQRDSVFFKNTDSLQKLPSIGMVSKLYERGKMFLHENVHNNMGRNNEEQRDNNLRRPNNGISGTRQQLTIDDALTNAITSLEGQKSVFSKTELIGATARESRGDFALSDILTAFDNNKELVVLKNDKFTSSKILNAEKNIISAIENGKNQNTPLLQDKSDLENQGYLNLTHSQKQGFMSIATTNDKIIAIQGDAGVGKTTMLSVFEQNFKDKVNLFGLAPTGQAVSELTKNGINSKTIDSFLLDKQKEQSDLKNIYVVDESSMIGTLKLDRLIDSIFSKDSNAQIVFVGDKNQLKAVEQGDMFAKMQEVADTTIMSQVLRQKSNLAKEFVAEFKSGNFCEALNVLQNNEKLFENNNVNELKNSLAKNASENIMSSGVMNVSVLVSTNFDKKELNSSIREHLSNNGILTNGHTINTFENKRLNHLDSRIVTNYKEGDVLISNQMQGLIKTGMQLKISSINQENNSIVAEYTNAKGESKQIELDGQKLANFQAFELNEIEIAEGDKIVFEKNDKNLDVQNGLTGEVISIKDDIATIQTNKNSVEINLSESHFLTHGYALTTHKAQGASVDSVHIFAPSESANYNFGYVQVTREKESIAIYTDNKDALAENWQEMQLKDNAIDHQLSNETQANSALDKLSEINDKIDSLDIQNSHNQNQSSDKLGEIIKNIENIDMDQDKQNEELDENQNLENEELKELEKAL